MAHVLVVDDDADSRDGLAGVLRKRGHHVTGAPSGREALGVLTRAQRPDLVVLDLRMPGMNGVTFLEVVRSYLRLHTLPVLLMTAYPESPEIERARELGVRDVFKKPDHFNALLDAIDAHGSST